MRRRASTNSGASAAVQNLRAKVERSRAAENPEETAHVTTGAWGLSDFEVLARKSISNMAFEHIYGGAADEITLRRNREALDRLRLRPRILVDVSKLDTRVRLFDQELPFPILLAPTAYQRLVHPGGELATARGAGAAGVVLVASAFSTVGLEEIARAASRSGFNPTCSPTAGSLTIWCSERRMPVIVLCA